MMLGTDGKPIADLATARATVVLEDGQALGDLRLKPGDYVKMERQFGISATELQTDARLEWVLYMLWLSAKRKHDYTGDFDAWLDAVDDVQFTSGPGSGPGEPVP